MGLFVRNAIFVKPIGNIVFDGEGVKECGLLKDHADTGAKFKEVGLTHASDILSEDANGAGIRSNEAVGQLHQN